MTEYKSDAYGYYVNNWYKNNPNGAEYNEKSNRTHIWRKLKGKQRHCVIIMKQPSTGTGKKNDKTITSTMNRLNEISEYNSMSIINIDSGYDWEETLTMWYNLPIEIDIIIAWGSKVSKDKKTENIRKKLRENYTDTSIYQWGNELMSTRLKANTPLCKWK